MHSDEKIHGASAALSLCGIALAFQEEAHRRYLTVGEMDGRIREDAK